MPVSVAVLALMCAHAEDHSADQCSTDHKGPSHNVALIWEVYNTQNMLITMSGCVQLDTELEALGDVLGDQGLLCFQLNTTPERELGSLI